MAQDHQYRALALQQSNLKAAGAGAEHPTQNTQWGFYGTRANAHPRLTTDANERHPTLDKEYDTARNELVGQHGGTHAQAREYLDSTRGRHLADAVGDKDGDIRAAVARGDQARGYKDFVKHGWANVSLDEALLSNSPMATPSESRFAKAKSRADTASNVASHAMLPEVHPSARENAFKLNAKAAKAHLHAALHAPTPGEHDAEIAKMQEHVKKARTICPCEGGAEAPDDEDDKANGDLGASPNTPGAGDALQTQSSRLAESQFQKPVLADPGKHGEHLTGRAIHLGALAHKQFKDGKNPASWVADEDIWDRAKTAANKSYSIDDDAYWPVVTTIYENMGGAVNGEANCVLPAELSNGDVVGHPFRGNQWKAAMEEMDKYYSSIGARSPGSVAEVDRAISDHREGLKSLDKPSNIALVKSRIARLKIDRKALAAMEAANCSMDEALIVANGDVAGHDFHGNQFSAAEKDESIKAAVNADEATARASKAGAATYKDKSYGAYIAASKAHEDARDAHNAALKTPMNGGGIHNMSDQSRSAQAKWHDTMSKRFLDKAIATGAPGRPNCSLDEALILGLANVALTEDIALVLGTTMSDDQSLANVMESGTFDGWAIISKYGDHPHPGMPDNPVPTVQRFDRKAADTIVANFKSTWGRIKRAVTGLPIYNGHPDVPSLRHIFKDKESKGTYADLQARDDGLYGRPVLTANGATVVEAGNDRLSPYWNCRPTGESAEDGRPIVSPYKLLSVGLVNRANIPGPSLMNWAGDGQPVNNPNPNQMNKERDLLIQILAALGQNVAQNVGDAELANSVQTAIAGIKTKGTSEAANAALLTVLTNAKLTTPEAVTTVIANSAALANTKQEADQKILDAKNEKIQADAEKTKAQAEVKAAKEEAAAERKASATRLANAAVVTGRILPGEKDALVVSLCNGDLAAFEAEAKKITEKKPVMKTSSTTMGLPNMERTASQVGATKFTKISDGVKARMEAKKETYDVAFANFQADPENVELFKGMKHPEIKTHTSDRRR
jgi:hypothetical protein